MEVTSFQAMYQCNGLRWEARGDKASWVVQWGGGWASSADHMDKCTSGAQRRGDRAIVPYDYISCGETSEKVVLVVLPDPFRGMGAWKNSTETQQSGHSPRSGPEVKNGRNGAKDGAPERLGCGIIHEEVSHILQSVSAGAVWRILLSFYSA